MGGQKGEEWGGVGTTTKAERKGEGRARRSGGTGAAGCRSPATLCTHTPPAGPGLQPDDRPMAPHSLEPQFLEGGAAGIIDPLPPSLLFLMPGSCLLHAALQLIGVTARVILGAAWGQRARTPHLFLSPALSLLPCLPGPGRLVVQGPA